MFFSLVVLVLSSLSLSALAFGSTSSRLYRRNSTASSRISTTILAPNGTDITSSFRTVVWFKPKIVAPDPSLTGRDNILDLDPRGTLSYSYLGRPVSGNNMCRSPTAEFQHSVCKRSLGVPATVQDFVVYCQETVPVPISTSGTSRTRQSQVPRPIPSTENRGGPASTSDEPIYPPILAEQGSCWEDEICIDGVFAARGYSHLASCVLEEDYGEDSDEDIDDELAGNLARITVTGLDAETPVRMRKLGIEAARRQGRYSRPGNLETLKECGDCYDLRTDSFAPDTDSLKLQASAMTAGAMAGIIWVAISAG